MKKHLLRNYSFLLVLAILSVANFQCKKDNEGNFCDVQRSVYVNVSNREGMIVFSNKYSRYAVSFTVNAPNNIDSQVIGFVCDLDKSLQKIGLRVVVSGTLRSFNSDEKITPEIGGQELYFLEISQPIRIQ